MEQKQPQEHLDFRRIFRKVCFDAGELLGANCLWHDILGPVRNCFINGIVNHEEVVEEALSVILHEEYGSVHRDVVTEEVVNLAIELAKDYDNYVEKDSDKIVNLVSIKVLEGIIKEVFTVKPTEPRESP